jgi:two-component system LytT family response regulator
MMRGFFVSRTLKVMEDYSMIILLFVCIAPFVFNLYEIEKFMKGEGGYLVMSDGSEISISRIKKKSC